MKNINRHMRSVSWLLLIACMCFSCGGNKEKHKMIEITWNNELSLPPCTGMTENKGLAGAFAGIIGGELVVTGGANFPDAYPWEGGHKTWWSTLYHIPVSKDTNPSSWVVKEDFLHRKLAYGVSVQLQDEILCIGGCDQDSCYADVFSIIKNKSGEVVYSDKVYPSLPVPLANAAGTIIGTKVFVAGGQEAIRGERSTKHFFYMDTKHPESGWISLPAWPGPSRAYAVCASQAGKFYLFSGRSFAPGEETIRHEDAYVYDPVAGSWEVLPGRYPVMAGTAIPFSSDKIVLLGGVPEILPSTSDHPGFSKEVLVFDIRDYSTVSAGKSPYPIPVTCHTLVKEGGFYIASGEIRPGVRTPSVLEGKWSK